jgi:hypothetical protein
MIESMSEFESSKELVEGELLFLDFPPALNESVEAIPAGVKFLALGEAAAGLLSIEGKPCALLCAFPLNPSTGRMSPDP